MHGNTPYAGNAGIDEPVEMTAAQRRALRSSTTRIAARTREFLPDEYVVGSEISTGMNGGPQVTVAVRPPIGNPVSAGFEPDFADGEGEDVLIPADEREEVARGLAASAALQVKQAIGDEDVAAAAK